MTYSPESDSVPLLPDSPQSAVGPPAPRAAAGLLVVLAALHVIDLAVWLLAALAMADAIGLRRLIGGGIAEVALAVGFGVAAALVRVRRDLGRLLVFTLSGLVVVRGFSHLTSIVLTATGFAIEWDAERYLSTSLGLVAAGLTVLAITLLTRGKHAPSLPEAPGDAAPRRPGAVLAAAVLLGCVAVIAGLAAGLEGSELATTSSRYPGYVSHLTSVAVLFAALAVAYLTAAVLVAAGHEAGRIAGFGCAGYLVWLGLQALASPPERLLLGVPAAAIGIAVIVLISGSRAAEWFDARHARLRSSASEPPEPSR